MKEHRKHRLDVYEGAAPIYNVVSSDNCQKLTLKLSKTKDESRGKYLMLSCYNKIAHICNYDNSLIEKKIVLPL